MATQQEVIRKFMAALDTTTLSGTAAVNAAIDYATNGTKIHFVDLETAVAQMVTDCQSSASGEDFLKNYCGIILGNDDTGAITGSDAGKTIKTAESIIPESGAASNFTGNSFTVNGLTVKLAQNYAALSDYEKYLWNNLHAHWIKNSLDLIAASYGDNFAFNSNSTVRELTVTFANAKTGYTAAVYPTFAANDKKITTALNLKINLYYYKPNAVDAADTDGKPNATGERYNVGYLDRTIAHELTHAVMQANIDYCYRLPQFITEGMAELTHGADDGLRTDDIQALAADPAKLEKALNGTKKITGITNPAYSGGYMFLRWLAKKSAVTTTPRVNIGNSLANTLLSGSNGNDTILNSGSNVTIIAGDGNDSIINSGSNVLIKYRAGGGNDTVQGFREDSTLQIGDGQGSYSAQVSGSNIIVTVDDGKITLRGAASLSSVNIDGKQIVKTLELTDSSSAKVTLPAVYASADASARTKSIQITGNALANSILGGSGNDTLTGGSGNDTLTGGKGADIFIYGAGNDVITDYAVGEKISLGAAIRNATLDGSDAVLNFNGGSLRIKDAKGKKLSLVTAAGTNLTTIIGGVIAYNSSAAKLTLGTGIEIADASTRTKLIQITGNALDNTILGGKSNDTLAGGAGNDSLLGGRGDDSLNGGSGNDWLQGGDGNDKLQGYTGNDTLIGGLGNDSLWGGSGSDIFIYNSGDGKDMIYNFDNSDMLQITGAWTAAYYNASDRVVFKVDSTYSAIILENSSATTFNVNGSTYRISGNTLVKN